MIIKDLAGNDLTYYPVTLVAGQDSAPFQIVATPTKLGQRLRATLEPNAKVLARVAGGGAYVDINATPMPLDAYYGASVTLEIIVRAAAEVLGVTRIYLFVGVTSGGAAAWLS